MQVALSFQLSVTWGLGTVNRQAGEFTETGPGLACISSKLP